MDWFFATNDSALAFPLYADLAKVAVHTALAHTRLRPYLLYDGKENAFSKWMHDHGVEVINLESSYLNDFAEIPKPVDDASRSALRGMFLKLELPQLGARLGLNDHVLYTDCDVMFCADVVDELSAIECRYFAVAGEFDPNNYHKINAGVMWMNLAGLREVEPAFRESVRTYLRRDPQGGSWDQGAFIRFFGGENFRWNKLRPELNWKPYWGANDQAKIIHFHGPKPYQRPFLDHIPQLHHLTVGAYDELSQEWERLLAVANAS
jgi:lipopolysaccharide biosynthesis glycosyltransferase